MRKVLLSAMALIATMTVNAQVVEIGTIDGSVIEAFDYIDTDSKYDVPAGTVFAETEHVTCSNLYQDEFATTSLSYGLIINGEEVEKANGVQGNTNGPNNSASEGVYPETGCIYKFDVTANGWLYVIHKGSNNKNYVAWEEHDRIPYYFAMYDPGTNYLGSFDLSNGYVDPNGNTASYYDEEWEEWFINDDYAILQPINYDPAIVGGVSVIKFPVYDGLTYLCYATGSKMSIGYFIYSDSEIEIRTTSEDEGYDVALCEAGDNTGINNLTVNSDSKSGAIYNIAGQRLSTLSKGINIVDGKKIIVK